MRSFSPLLPRGQAIAFRVREIPVSGEASEALYLACQSTRRYFGIPLADITLHEVQSYPEYRVQNDELETYGSATMSRVCFLAALIHQRAVSSPPIPHNEPLNEEDAMEIFKSLLTIRARESEGMQQSACPTYFWIVLTGLASSRRLDAKAFFYGESVRTVNHGLFMGNGEMNISMSYLIFMQRRCRGSQESEPDIALLRAFEDRIISRESNTDNARWFWFWQRYWYA
jgi:hypothetical protein